MRRVTGFVVVVAGLLLGFALSSCGGSSTPPPAASFTLSAAPTTVSLTPGATGQSVSLTATAVNGFSQSVSVAITGLPAGVAAAPSSVTLTPGAVAAAQSVTLTATGTAAAGSATIKFTGTSGALSSAASVALTVNSPPSFSLSLQPTTLALTVGATGAKVSVLATAANSFSGTVSVAITGLPAGVTANPATLSLTPGTAQSTTLTASTSAAAGMSTVTFTGTSGSLTSSANLALTVQTTAPPTNAPDVTTYRDDNARDGLNANETILDLTTVNSTQFGKIGFDPVDGIVDAEPLYIANISVGGKSRNVLYVATENDTVYAFDADSGAQLWKTSIIGSGETTSDDHGCGQITPQIGVTSTPVIDRKQGTNGTIFAVGMTKDASGNYHQRLHALDLTTGAEISGSPTEISGTYPGTGANSQNGNVVFDPAQYAERAGLLLLNGTIYLGWTSHCDQDPYSGWVMGYSESTLQQTQILDVTPNGSGGSLWMAGDGMAADGSGNIYFLDANGTFDTSLDNNGFPSSGDFGNAMIKLSTSSAKIAVADYFNEYNTQMESAGDLDLGSGGEILLPDLTDAGGTVHQLIVGAGKDMNIYIADRNNLGKYNGNSDSNIYQQVSGQLGGPVFSTPAYFNNTIYYGAVGDNLKAFPLTNAQLATAPSSLSAATFAYPGATPAISANGTQDGIVWAVESSTGSPAVLHAYDATNLAHELYNSSQAASGRDAFGNGNKFITPMIVNGKVYIGTATGVAVFGLLSK